jgi:hypothetical protein
VERLTQPNTEKKLLGQLHRITSIGQCSVH